MMCFYTDRTCIILVEELHGMLHSSLTDSKTLKFFSGCKLFLYFADTAGST